MTASTNDRARDLRVSADYTPGDLDELARRLAGKCPEDYDDARELDIQVFARLPYEDCELYALAIRCAAPLLLERARLQREIAEAQARAARAEAVADAFGALRVLDAPEDADRVAISSASLVQLFDAYIDYLADDATPSQGDAQ
jgi:hypothetical protein